MQGALLESFCPIEATIVAPIEQPVSRPSILIIDDDHDTASILSHRLGKQGFHTITADCGELGLAMARDEQPHAILLDLRLPDRDGLSICEELSDDESTGDIPVIVVSGLEQDNILRLSRAAGCRYYLRKPYDPNVLLAVVKQAIEERETL